MSHLVLVVEFQDTTLKSQHQSQNMLVYVNVSVVHKTQILVLSLKLNYLTAD